MSLPACLYSPRYCLNRMHRIVSVLSFVVMPLVAASLATGDDRVLESRMRHIRFGEEREWTEFPEQAEASEFQLNFELDQALDVATLRIRHRDVKQRWVVEVNNARLGTLPVDENQMVTFWSIPSGTLKRGSNRLRVHGSGRAADDVLIGDVRLDARPREQVLSEARVEVRVLDADSRQPLPSRITVLDESASLMTTGAESNQSLAVRPGVVFSANGSASLPLSAGKYTIVAGRGFEYTVDMKQLELKPGDVRQLNLAIRREVPTLGYVACDTHCHTFTHSRHGDATIEERMITLAAECVELPVAADHNIQIDYHQTAVDLGVRQYFTPIVGNEVTTSVGHFNVFPLNPGPATIDHRGQDWPSVFEAIFQNKDQQRLVVLNHPRDIHAGFRPFDPKRHIGIAGERLDGQVLRANLMETINSGTTQSDGLQLFHDWFGLLNRGLKITAVGSSDSHDVARHFVGQGRTYVRCADDKPGEIDLDQAYASLLAGRVSVSYGLLAEITVDREFGPGDFVPRTSGESGSRLHISARVLGPHWCAADRVTLYANGVPIREVDIDPEQRSTSPGVIWQGTWEMDRPSHDVFLAIIGTGPGIRQLYWPTPKPYQPTSTDWTPYSLGATGAVWIDGDGDGVFTSAYTYAQRLAEKSGGNISRLLKELSAYDEAVAIQAASIWAAMGQSPLNNSLQVALATAAPHVQQGFERYAQAWKQSQQAKLAP